MYQRKPNHGLSREALKSLSAADHRSKTIGCPLNTMITLRPLDERNLSMPERCKEFLRIRNNYDGFARRTLFEPAFVWTREIFTNCTGEHMHLLCYVPQRRLPHLKLLALAWMPFPSEIDVRRAGVYEYTDGNGKRRSSLLYIAKQMTSQAVFGTNFIRQKGGIILGQRWNCSRNLMPENTSSIKNQNRIAELMKGVLAHIEIPGGSNVESDY